MQKIQSSTSSIIIDSDGEKTIEKKVTFDNGKTKKETYLKATKKANNSFFNVIKKKKQNGKLISKKKLKTKSLESVL